MIRRRTVGANYPPLQCGADFLDTLHQMLEDFDFGMQCDDFLLYEAARLIEEDRASFDDDEFRQIIDQGIREYAEENLATRAAMAGRIRAGASKTDRAATRLLRALEDTEFDLRNASEVIMAFTAYLFKRLEECTEGTAASDDAVSPLAERLFDSLDN